MLLGNGFWMLGQTQIFDSWVNVRATSLTFMPTSHNFGILEYVTQSTPMLIITIAMFLMFLAQALFKKTLKQNGFGFSSTKI
jgi:hypothetical protein